MTYEFICPFTSLFINIISQNLIAKLEICFILLIYNVLTKYLFTFFLYSKYSFLNAVVRKLSSTFIICKWNITKVLPQ